MNVSRGFNADETLSTRYEPSQSKKRTRYSMGIHYDENESSSDSHAHRKSLPENTRFRQSKEQTFFETDVDVGKAASRNSPVLQSNNRDEEISESAIDDDYSSSWEECGDTSCDSSMNERHIAFQRVDSTVNLTSRGSMLTILMHESSHSEAMASEASCSTPASRRSIDTRSKMSFAECSPIPGIHVQLHTAKTSGSKPIVTTISTTMPSQQFILSPQMTRRNMFSTELTEPLRRNLLLERQHWSTGSLTVPKKRHTSTDGTTFEQQPSILCRIDDVRELHNHFFEVGLNEYHVKGW